MVGKEAVFGFEAQQLQPGGQPGLPLRHDLVREDHLPTSIGVTQSAIAPMTIRIDSTGDDQRYQPSNATTSTTEPI
eukprot:scaffold231467_cov16-Prasinocladus_malaysianus.AAC.1